MEDQQPEHNPHFFTSMSPIRIALPFIVLVVCQTFQSRSLAATMERAKSTSASSIAQINSSAAKRDEARWLLHQPALRFDVTSRRVSDNTEQLSLQLPHVEQTHLSTPVAPNASMLWKSEQALGRRWVVLVLAPRPQRTARGGQNGQQPVPQPSVLRSMTLASRQLAQRGGETFLILPDGKAEERTSRLLQQNRQKASDKSANALHLSGDESTWRALGRGFKSTQPAIVVLDRAGFVRRAQMVNSWNDVNTLLTSLDDPTPMLEVNRLAPTFAIRDMNGILQRLEDYRGRNLLLTFFPKCFTGYCTNHLTSIQAVWGDLVKSNTQVLAVSVDEADSIRGQKAFARSMRLDFPLIPDVNRNLSILYGAATYPQELASRMSVLIDGNGIVRWISKDIVMSQHGLDVLKKIEEFNFAKLPQPQAR